MKITRTKTVTSTIDVTIEFPYYSKSGVHWFKVTDENTCIQVTMAKYIHTQITQTYVCLAFNESCEDSNEEEFNNAFNSAWKQIKTLKEKL